jgi:DNA-binding GntR family transcriptional regulator
VRDPGGVERRPDRRRIRKPDELAVRRSLLRDAAFTILLENVLLGVYRRGERLRLEQIADDLQVSRTPVREALTPLESLRLVSVQRYVGVVIANWTVGQMCERLRIARSMLVEPLGGSAGVSDRFDRRLIAECRTEAGCFVELGAWVLRRSGASVSADWLESQFAVLDVFFTDDVCLANGIDAAVDRRYRVELLERARSAAERDAVTACTEALVELADALIGMPERFGVALSA